MSNTAENKIYFHPSIMHKIEQSNHQPLDSEIFFCKIQYFVCKKIYYPVIHFSCSFIS